MFWRKTIGTGAASRTRPSRTCRVGLEPLDVRAVPAIIPGPGAALNPAAPIHLTFDENGNAFSPSGPLPSTVASIAGNPTTLVYQLPGPVVPGDVRVLGSGEGTSDLLRFTDVLDPATGTVQGLLLYYSDAGDAAPADTGIPAGVSPFTPFVFEFGPEGFNQFTYTPLGASDFYAGISDGTIL
jgi:hypothetical protein